MLSKVLTRGNTAGAQVLVFPNLAGYERGGNGCDSSDPATDLAQRPPRNRSGDVDGADLREKLNQLESRTAAERAEAFDGCGVRQG